MIHPTMSELNFADSMGQWLRTVVPPSVMPANKIINSDDVVALSDVFQDESNKQFIIYALGEAHGDNTVIRNCAVGVLTRLDPGNRRCLALVDHLRGFIDSGLSIPLRNYMSGDGEIVTQMAIMDVAVGPFFDEADDFRSKTIAFAVGYGQVRGSN
jgi:hypothetical protein